METLSGEMPLRGRLRAFDVEAPGLSEKTKNSDMRTDENRDRQTESTAWRKGEDREPEKIKIRTSKLMKTEKGTLDQWVGQ